MDERSVPALAIIGMAGRFPGGSDLRDYWSLLEQGRSAVRALSDRELREAGVSEALLRDPSYVKYCMPFEGPDLFDAGFFGYSPRQAAAIDPQQRLFLEYAWEALERAGYGAVPPRLTVGVFGGSGFNGYFERCMNEDLRTDPGNVFQAIVDGGKDFLTGRVAYKLGLTGPSISVQTACSTSLVALHLASQSLLSYECDIALAGGATVPLPPYTGYRFVEGSILSRDGACRAYEADASGTIPGGGAAVVVLRRLADAIADGDAVLAVIRGTVVNNDGSRKIGFTAPGLDSQVRLLRTALELAGLSPSDIDLVEGHGTGTALGDPIELTALQEVYSSPRPRRKPCVLGSVKTNIGHADTAAGIAGLIKVVLCLRHRTFVANAGSRKPHSMLTSEPSVFRLLATAAPWTTEAGRLRRAAVSSFGLGGVNAHAIVEEAPHLPAPSPSQEPDLFPVSARTHAALEQQCVALASHLETHEPPMRDVAFTLQVGRRAFDHRRFVVGTHRKEIAAALRAPARRWPQTSSTPRPVIFLFPGQGAQQLGMIADIYATDRELANDVDLCAEVLKRQGPDLRDVLCRRRATGDCDIDDTSLTQPALFITEYCLARFWMRQGLLPAAVLGHSVGEYAAACIAGVIGVEDTLRLVAHRARLSRNLPDGVMVAVNLPEWEVERLLTPSVQIAAVNAFRQCVVSGVSGAMQKFMAGLDSRGVEYQRLAVAKPFHNAAATPVAEGLLHVAAQLQLSAPRIPWISSVTAERMSDAQSKSPEHWARHVLKPVRFAASLRALSVWENSVFLEVGPGRVLTGLARQEFGSPSLFLSLPLNGAATRTELLATLGEMWLAGAAVDFAAQPRRGGRRVELPPHPLERKSYLRSAHTTVEPRLQPQPSSGARLAPERWFNLPSWQRTLFPAATSYDAAAGAWLLITDKDGFADSLARKLRRANQDVICVRPGAGLAVHSRDEYELNVDVPEHFDEVFARLQRAGVAIGRIVHCATLSESADGREPSAATGSAMSLAHISRVVGDRGRTQPLSLLVVTNRLHDISGYERPDVHKALLPVFCRCIAQESLNTRCVVVDLPPPASGQRLAVQYASYENRLLAELERGTDPTLAYRQDWRFAQTWSAVELRGDEPALRELVRGGHYVITGGLGRIGLALAGRLARECQAKLLLIARGAFPERGAWKSLAEAGSADDAIATRVRKLLEIEAAGSEVLVTAAGLDDGHALAQALSHAERQLGPVRGVFHLAADLGRGTHFRRMAQLDRAHLDAQLRPKARGLLAMIEALGSRRIDFGVAFSSNSATLGGVGYGAYAGANAVMDSLIASRADERLAPWMSLGWDGWPGPGATPDAYTVGVEEGLDTLWRACRFGCSPHLIISAMPLEPRVDTWVRGARTAQTERAPVCEPPSSEGEVSARVLPRSALEFQIAQIWQELLGMETIGVTESFLELGGDSLIGVRVISRIKDTFHVSLAPASLLGPNSTVDALSRDVVRAMAQRNPEALLDIP
jgi:phthiocerol/phenolphthiocerol synthesis type-I polyketide synthase E